MKDYIQTSTYEYVYSYFLNNQIIEPQIIYSSVFDRAKSDENTPRIYPIKNDEGQNHLDYQYYTYIAVKNDDDTYSYNPLQNPTKDIISCAYSFTNITKYYDEDHNEFISPTIVKEIDTDGTIYINDVGIAQIKTDFYENTYYFIDSTYYNLKVLYPTKLSLRYGDYFNSDPNIIIESDHNSRTDIISGQSNVNYNQIDQLIDCTEKFDSEHNVIQNNVFVRFPSRDFIDYKVDDIKDKYNASFEPNYIYKYELSSNIPAEALNIFNELTGTLSLNSYYISNNSYVDLKCRVLYERDNFFSPYYFIHLNSENNPSEIKTSEIVFRHYFKKLLPMKYELEDNTYVVYLNEAIEDSLKNKNNDGLLAKYGPTPITMTLTGLSINSNNISIQDTTSHTLVPWSLVGRSLHFIGTFGHEYLFSLSNTSYIIGRVYDNTNEAAISNAKFKFAISRNENKSKAIIVQSTFIGTQNPYIDPDVTDQAFKDWINEHEDVSISNINISIGSPALPEDDDDYVSPVITKKEIVIECESSVTTSNIGSTLSLTRLNPCTTKIKGTNNIVSGLTLTWKSKSSSIASVSGNTIKINAKGSTIITVSFAGNDSYKSASTQYTLNVQQGESSEISDESVSLSFSKSAESVSISTDELHNILSINVTPTNYIAKGYTLEYSTSNTSIAEITTNNDKKYIKCKKDGQVQIIATLKKGSTTLASAKYVLTITIVPAKIAVSFKIKNKELTKGNEYAGLSDSDAYFYPTTIYIRYKSNSSILYRTSVEPSTGNGTNNRFQLKLDSSTTIINKYGGGLLEPLDWSRHVYLRDNPGQFYFEVQGYIGQDSQRVKSFHAELSKYNDHTETSQYQSTPQVQIDIDIYNRFPNQTSGTVYTGQNPFENDNELSINSLNQAYSDENRSIDNSIIYGEGEDNNEEEQQNIITIDGTDIVIEEYGLIQIEEMPELYLPKDLSNESYNKLEFRSSNKSVADIMYWDYNPVECSEAFVGILNDDNEEELKNKIVNRLKPKLLIHRNGESIISVKYQGDDVYAETINVSFKLIVKLKGYPQLSLDEDKFEIERQLASAIDESMDNEDPLSGFQTFQSPTPNVICEESIPVAFEYFSSNNAIGTPYGDLGDILIFDIGNIKVTIKLKETKKYHTATTSYQLTIKNPPDKTETILNVEQSYYQIRFTQYVDKKIYRVYDAIDNGRKHLVFETNLYTDISKIEDNLKEYSNNDNIKEYLIENIRYDFYYKNSDIPCVVYDDSNNQISSVNNYYDFINVGQYSWLFDKFNGNNIPLFDYENVEYSDNFTIGKVRLNCYDVLDEDGNHGYYIYSRGLTSRLKTDSNNFIKGPILGTYIDKHLKIVQQKDSLGIPDSTYPTYSENFATYGMQIIDIDNPKESKAFRHAFATDLMEYVNDGKVYMSSVKGGCSFYVKPSSISSDDYDWKEKLMFLKDYDNEELNHQIFKSKYTSNNTDEDVEYIFTSSVPEIAKTNKNGDVIIYGPGKVKIMIRSTETENFTSGETGYVLDILPKERPMLESKYNRYLYEMDTTLVENVFGRPDLEWNNTDPDAKLLFWIRNGGPSDDKNSYLDLTNIDGLKFDENNLDDEDWANTSTEASEYDIMISANESNYMNIGRSSEVFYQICKNESNITNLEINDFEHKIYLKNCNYKFYSFNGNEILENEPNLYNMVFKTNDFLNVEKSSSFISLQTNYGRNVLKSLTLESGIVNDNYVKDVDGDFTIKFYLNVIPVFDSSKNNFVYCLPEHVNDSSNPYDNVSPRTFNDWYYIDPLYIVDENNANKFRIYSNKYRNRYCIKNGQPSSVLDLSTESIQELIDIVGNVVNTVEPIATISGGISRNHYYISNQDQDDEDYGALNNVYADDIDINDNDQYNRSEIIYGASKVAKDEFQTELEIIKSITYRYIDENGNVVYTDKDGNPLPAGQDPLTTTNKYIVSVDEAGNITIGNGLIGHVINVLVKSIETDNFKPTYLVYNVVIKSILDHGNGDGTEQGNGYAVSTTKKTNSALLDQTLIEVRTNPYAENAENNYKIISAPIFSCSCNDPDLSVEYYIYDGGEINGNEWYASHYFKEFRRDWYKNPSSKPAKNIVEIINGKTYQQTNDNGEYGEISTIKVTDRYGTTIKFDGEYQNKELASIDSSNGNLKISSLLHDRVINVMIYFTGTSEYYDNCLFYNVKVLTKNETILTIPKNIFNVAQPYPYGEILQFPEVKTNNTDTDEIKYYITARQVGRLLHDTDRFIDHLNSGDNTIIFSHSNNDGLYWEKSYGHYADNVNTERKTSNFNNDTVSAPQYSPINILLSNSDNDKKPISISETTTWPSAINDNGNTLFSIYKNGQIRYTNKAGRYVLNICVISEETTNFLQGYGFYNLEVEVKDEPTLGIYPPYIKVRVGTNDVYVEAPNIICSNNDSNATLSFEIHAYVESGGSTDDPTYLPDIYTEKDINVDEVGNIIIKGGLFTNNPSIKEKKWWIKVTSNPSPNFGEKWEKFLIHAIDKEEAVLTLIPNNIKVRYNSTEMSIKAPEILCNNDDPEFKINFEVTSGDANQIKITNVDNNRVFKINSGVSIGQTWTLMAKSIETTNFKEASETFTITIIDKEQTALSIFPKTIKLIKSDKEISVKCPDISCSNTDPEHKLLFSLNPISDNNATPNYGSGNITIDSSGNATISANTITNTTVYVYSTETTNFKSASNQFNINVAEKAVPTLTINGGSSSMNLTRTVVVGSEVFAGPVIEHNNTDKDVKVIYISSDTSTMTVTPKGALMVYKTGNVSLTIKLSETENFQAVSRTNAININISQQTIPST